MDQGVFVDLTEQRANQLSYTTAETLMAYKDKEKARANARSLAGQFHRKSWSYAQGPKTSLDCHQTPA